MTSIARTPSLDVLLALCCECGTTRTVSRRAVGSDGNRPLRCETCRKTTPHAAIGAEGRWDNGEEQNRRTKPKLSAADKLDVLRSLDVAIDDEDTLEAADGSRAIMSLWWWFDEKDVDLEDDVFRLIVNRDSTDAERDERLSTVLKYVTEPREHMWFVKTGDDGPAANVCWGTR